MSSPATRPGNLEDFGIPQAMLSRRGKAWYSSMAKVAVTTGSWRHVSSELMEDMSSKEYSIVVAKIQSGPKAYELDVSFMTESLRDILGGLRQSELDIARLHSRLLLSSTKRLWMTLGMVSLVPMGILNQDKLDPGERAAAYWAIMQGVMNWWDHLEWLNDRLIIPFVSTGWPSWYYGLTSLALSLGMTERKAQRIHGLAPKEARIQLVKWMTAERNDRGSGARS